MSRLFEHLAKLDGVGERLAAETLVWSAVNSGSGNLDGLVQVARLAEARMAGIGLEVTHVAGAPVPVIEADGRERQLRRGGVLVGRMRPQAQRRIVLAGHLDTVFAASDPFQSAWREGGVLRGPGVADMKGGVLLALEALSCVLASGLAGDCGFDLILNSDEEIGSFASRAVFEQMGRGASAGFVFEPAMEDGALAGARAGSGNYAFVVRGRSAHAGRAFAEGRNALTAAARLVGALDALNGLRRGATVNVGLVQGGGALNVVPDLCVVKANIRALDPADLAFLDAAIHGFADDARAGAFGADIALEVHGHVHRPAKPMDGLQRQLFDVVRAASDRLGEPLAVRDTGGVCDGNTLASVGVAVVDTLGVVGGGIHTDAEYARIDSFATRGRLAALSMLMLVSGEAPWPKQEAA